MHARIESPALTVPGALEALQGLSDAGPARASPRRRCPSSSCAPSQINGCSISVDITLAQLRIAGEPGRAHLPLVAALARRRRTYTDVGAGPRWR
jgi:hypothetical protein